MSYRETSRTTTEMSRTARYTSAPLPSDAACRSTLPASDRTWTRRNAPVAVVTTGRINSRTRRRADSRP